MASFSLISDEFSFISHTTRSLLIKIDELICEKFRSGKNTIRNSINNGFNLVFLTFVVY